MMKPREWVVKETNRYRTEAVRFLMIVHSRCESLRKLGRDFNKPELIKKMREAKKKVREARKIVDALPRDLGRKVLQAKPLQPSAQGVLPFGQAAS